MADKDSIVRRLSDLSPDKRDRLRKLLKDKERRIPRRAPGQRVPLSFGQQRIWIVSQMLPGSPAYNESNFIRLRHPLNVDLFRRAVNEVIRRHEALRMFFEEGESTPAIQVRPSLTLDIPLIDLRQLAVEDREPEALKRAAEQAQIPFDLTQGPLLRASLIRLDEHEYLFALTIHHIACDGWSMGVLAVELSILYWTFVQGKASPLPELKIQYPDFALWQNQMLTTDVVAPQLAYWRGQLAGLPTFELPADHPRPPHFTFRGARVPIVVPQKTYAALSALCERYQVTPHLLLLAAFFVLLRRYSGQTDIVVATPMGGRNRKELEPLIGFFVNTLVMRADISGEPRFSDFLQSVRQLAFTAYANQDVPFERLIEDLQPVRDQSRNPLAQVAFQVFQPPGASGINLDHIFPFAPVDTGVSKFDLTLQLILGRDGLRGHFEYCVDLFEAARIERMALHFLNVLESITADIDQPISQLKMLLPADEKQILVEWNDTAASYPRESNIPAVFASQVLANPEHAAVRFGDRELTYAELDRQASRVAAHLNNIGVGKGSAVALLMERSLEYPVVFLALTKLGAIAVPLDPAYPLERLTYLLSDCGADTVVTISSFEKISEKLGVQTVLMEDALADRESVDVPDVAVGPGDVACLMYTSGTTGQPKGVAVTHRNILRLVKGVSYVKLDSSEAVAQIAPLTFDASSFEIWGSLLNGATMIVSPPGVPALDELGRFIKDNEISLLFITTCLFNQLLESNARDLRSVRQLITGGEVMSLSLARTALKELPRTRVFNAYGPTECTTFSTIYPLTSTELIGDNVPIGKPIDNTTTFILDRELHPVPIGVPGELYIGGDAVAAGYWRKPELTAEYFLSNPFSDSPGQRIYRTGDVAKYRDDGNILFLGRYDRQVKISGHRIEIAEVEAAIARHPDVTAVAVVLPESGENRLAAFVELLPDRSLTYATLRQFLVELIPNYMIPSSLETLTKLPVTANGKIDYVDLARRTTTISIPADAYVPPASRTEELLARIWQETLGAERIGVTDNFFELGGQSLVATRLLSRMREAFQAEITMRQFFDNPTIGGVASLLTSTANFVKQDDLMMAFARFSRSEGDFSTSADMAFRHEEGVT